MEQVGESHTGGDLWVVLSTLERRSRCERHRDHISSFVHQTLPFPTHETGPLSHKMCRRILVHEMLNEKERSERFFAVHP